MPDLPTFPPKKDNTSWREHLRRVVQAHPGLLTPEVAQVSGYDGATSALCLMRAAGHVRSEASGGRALRWYPAEASLQAEAEAESNATAEEHGDEFAASPLGAMYGEPGTREEDVFPRVLSGPGPQSGAALLSAVRARLAHIVDAVVGAEDAPEGRTLESALALLEERVPELAEACRYATEKRKALGIPTWGHPSSAHALVEEIGRLRAFDAKRREVVMNHLATIGEKDDRIRALVRQVQEAGAAPKAYAGSNVERARGAWSTWLRAAEAAGLDPIPAPPGASGIVDRVRLSDGVVIARVRLHRGSVPVGVPVRLVTCEAGAEAAAEVTVGSEPEGAA